MKGILPSILFLLIAAPVLAQDSSRQRPVDSIPRDEYGNIRWRDEKPVLDRYANMLRQSPGSVVYIFSYGGLRTCKGWARARARRARNYLVATHGIAANRVFWSDGGFRVEDSTELWLRLPGETHPTPYATVNREAVRLIRCAPARRKRVGPVILLLRTISLVFNWTSHAAALPHKFAEG